MKCFNCETTVEVGRFSLDMDLPTLEACRMCMFAVALGDEDMLRSLRPRRRTRSRGKR